MKKDIVGNKLFWKTVKPSLYNKVIARLSLSENSKIVKTELERAKFLNAFYSNIINLQNLTT